MKHLICQNGLVEQISAIENAKFEIEYTTSELIRNLERLAIHCNKIAQGLRANNEMYVNPLGEVQSDGLNVDTACARLAEQRRALKWLLKVQSELNNK